MPSNPKLYIPGGVHFITFRTEQGLPFVAAEHVKLILEGILARATERYNVTLCHYIWMGNHVHLIIVVRDPEAVAEFLCYLKTESAHAVNRMLGNRRKTVWCAGSDSPVMLTAESVIERIAYVYANPALSHLVDKIEDYPMLSSWEMYCNRRSSKKCPVVSRDQIHMLGTTHLSLRQQAAFTASLKAASQECATLKISPYAWMECFPEYQGVPHREVDKLILTRIREKEEDARKDRKGRVMGELALRTQDVDTEHQPQKFSRKSICISSEQGLRIDFLTWAKTIFDNARRIYRAWKNGDFSQKYPPGLFPPRYPRQANLLSPL